MGSWVETPAWEAGAMGSWVETPVWETGAIGSWDETLCSHAAIGGSGVASSEEDPATAGEPGVAYRHAERDFVEDPLGLYALQHAELAAGKRRATLPRRGSGEKLDAQLP